jgi:hypothetical protein
MTPDQSAQAIALLRRVTGYRCCKSSTLRALITQIQHFVADQSHVPDYKLCVDPTLNANRCAFQGRAYEPEVYEDCHARYTLGESLGAIAKSYPSGPSKATVTHWKRVHDWKR